MPTPFQDNLFFPAQLASQQTQWLAFANASLESSLKLLELSWQVTKDSLDDSTQTAQQLLAAKSPQELFQIDSEKVRDNFNRLMSYAGAVANLATTMQSELRKVTQEQFGGVSTQEPAPAGETKGTQTDLLQDPFDLMKSAMENARIGYETWVSATRKVADVAGANLNIDTGEISRAKRKSGAK